MAGLRTLAGTSSEKQAFKDNLITTTGTCSGTGERGENSQYGGSLSGFGTLGIEMWI